MNQADTPFQALRSSADEAAVAAIEQLVREAPDHALYRTNALAFAARNGLDEEPVIAAFLHAARLGLFELSWNVLCPGCGGVLDAGTTLKTVNRAEYSCALCAAGYEPTLDEMVEVTFTVSPRVRRVAAHDPNSLPMWDYCRQIFWGSGVDLPRTICRGSSTRSRSRRSSCRPAKRRCSSLQLPAKFVIVFDPVTHATQFLDVKGEPTRERQNLRSSSTRCTRRTRPSRCVPGRCGCRSRTAADVRVLPGVWVADERLHDLLGHRRPFLTAKRLLTNQTFRDIYRTDTLDVDQRLKITSLTFLFTDLRGSTELYERVGDLAAFDLVRAHFRVLTRDRGGRSRGGREDHRRRRDGDLSDAGPGGRCRPAHARRDAPSTTSKSARTCCSRSASTRGRASPSRSTTARTISGRR